jgi:hypothetical protein
MTATPDAQSSLRAARAPAVFKAMAIATFAFGAAMHTLRLIIGIEAVIAHVLTPAVDVAFGAFIAGTAAAGLKSWRRFSGGKAGRAGYAFAMFMLIVSVPVHLRTAVTWSTAYLTAFPTWYSIVEIPMFLALVLIVSLLRFRGGAQNAQTGAMGRAWLGVENKPHLRRPSRVWGGLECGANPIGVRSASQRLMRVVAEHAHAA